jgi:penicillin amidase
VTHRYTRHGPVVFTDEAAGIAYAVRAAWMEVGGAPYLASLRMDQASSWEEFREACTYSHLPGENMIWADPGGTIGWQAVGIAPIRRSWSGLVPVPGDGRYEWDGYLPIQAKPHLVDPPEGYFASANNHLIPQGYPFPEAVGFEWSDPYRWLRAVEVLGGGRRFSLSDMAALQTDELSIPARTLVPLLEGIEVESPQLGMVRERLLAWDFVLDRNSPEAGVYVAWERRIRERVSELMIPEELGEFLGSVSMRRTLNWLLTPTGDFGEDPIAGRDALLLEALEGARGEMVERFGEKPEAWVYGQEEYKHIRLRHPLSRAVNSEWLARLEVGPTPRGGNSFTLNQTGGGDNQSTGASFRILVDTGDWDLTLGMNNPGQGGHPDHPHYSDLFQLWAQDRFHPVFYSRELVESVTGERIVLTPGN